MVAKKIKATKDNKSPGVDGIPPKLSFLLNGKKQTSYHYLKKGSRNKSEN